MKHKFFKILNISLISIAPMCISTSLASCAKLSDTPHDNLSKKLVDFVTADDIGSESIIASYFLYTDNESKMPYIALNDFVQLFNTQFSKYSFCCAYQYSKSGHDITVTKLDGQENTSNVAKVVFKIDENKVVFYNYVSFVDPEKIDNGFDIGGSDAYFINDMKKVNWYVKGNERVIDLNKYGFKSYFFNNDGYLPYYVLNNVFTRQFETQFLYNGNDRMLDFAKLTDYGKSASLTEYLSNGMFNKKYMEEIVMLNYLNFNELFGLDKRKHPLTGEVITMPRDEELLKTFDKQAEYSQGTFRELFQSTKTNVFKTAMTEFGAWYFDDGGHTHTDYADIFSDSTAKQRDVWRPKSMYSNTLRTKGSLIDGRSKAETDPTYVPEGQPKISPATVHNDKAVGCYVEYTKNSNVSDNIAYLTFDRFGIPSSSTKHKPEEITKDNYYLDTMSLVSYTNKQIRDHGIKNLVLDISVNGGGAVTALSFILSWICNGATEIFFNRRTNSSYSATYYADVNLDNKFDENDVLPKDVNLYVITSNASFSCGNALPVFIKMFSNRNNVKFLGERSGGGSCIVMNGLETGVGSAFRFSGPIQIGGIGCDKDNLIDNEDGESVDIPFTLDKSKESSTDPTYKDVESFIKFYDRKSINEAIWNKEAQ